MKQKRHIDYSKMSVEELTERARKVLDEINIYEAEQKREKDYIASREQEYNRLISKKLLKPIEVKRIVTKNDLWKSLGYLGTLPYESIVVIACKSDDRVCDVFNCTVESNANSAIPDSGYVLERTREHKADYIYMAHNHPNGTLKESEDDIALTELTRKIMETFNIKLKDHIIVTLKNLYSIEKRKVVY